MPKSTDEIIQEISEVLAEADGLFIETIANQVLSHPVQYFQDSLFLCNRQYHAFSIMDISGFQMFVEEDKAKCDKEFQRILKIMGGVDPKTTLVECYKMGTVEADSVNEALNKIRRDEWKTMEVSIPKCTCDQIKSGDRGCMCDVCARVEIS